MTEMMYFTVPDISLWDLDNMNVNELVEWATAIRDQVPEQYREASKLDYETHDCGASLQVRWSRPKTAEDIELERREKERRAVVV